MNGADVIVNNNVSSEVEIAYYQTQKALKDAIDIQNLLKEKLKTLEIRNIPARWNKPVQVQSFESTRGRNDSGDFTPEQLLQELKTAQHMLENAKRANETARVEQEELQKEFSQFLETAEGEADAILTMNATHYKVETATVQNRFQVLREKWEGDKSDLLSETEHISMISHDALHKASKMRESVEMQRRKIQTLAAEFRHDLAKSKELRATLDRQKSNILLTDNLTIEMDENKQKSDMIQNCINEQKLLLRAVRVSEAAKQKIDELNEQVEELRKTQIEVERVLEESKQEYASLEKLERELKQNLIITQTDFKSRQMEVFVLEANIRELKDELNLIKRMALDEGKKNVELSRELRKKRMEATSRFFSKNHRVIHRSEVVAHSLRSVHSSLFKKHLPPLLPFKRSMNLTTSHTSLCSTQSVDDIQLLKSTFVKERVGHLNETKKVIADNKDDKYSYTDDAYYSDSEQVSSSDKHESKSDNQEEPSEHQASVDNIDECGSNKSMDVSLHEGCKANVTSLDNEHVDDPINSRYK